MAELPEGATIVSQPPATLPEGATIVSGGELDQLGPLDAATLVLSPLLSPQTAGREVATGMGSGIAGSVVGGIAGVATLLKDLFPGGDKPSLSAMTDTIKTWQERMGVNPDTPLGQKMQEDIGGAIETIINTTEATIGAVGSLATGSTPEEAVQTFSDVQERGGGDVVMDKTNSPALATATDLAPDIAMMFMPGIKRLKPSTAPKPTRTKATPEQRAIIRAFEKDEITINEAIAKLEEIGEGGMIADVGGANVNLAATHTGGITRRGRDARDAAIAKRDADLLKNRTKESERLYGEAYAKPIKDKDAFVELLNHPAITDYGVIKEAIKLIKTKPNKKLNSAQRTEALSMFDGKGGIVYENINPIGLDHLARALRQRAGGTKIKQGETSASFKDHGELIKNELRKQNDSYGQALDAYTKSKSKEELFDATNKNTQMSDNTRLALQESLSRGNNMEKIAAMSTDALFAFNQNRFAMLRLIQDTAGLFRRGKVKRESGGQAEILYDIKDARSQLQEIANIVGQKSKLDKALQLSDSQLINWLRSGENLRIVAELGARAIVVEARNQEEN